MKKPKKVIKKKLKKKVKISIEKSFQSEISDIPQQLSESSFCFSDLNTNERFNNLPEILKQIQEKTQNYIQKFTSIFIKRKKASYWLSIRPKRKKGNFFQHRISRRFFWLQIHRRDEFPNQRKTKRHPILLESRYLFRKFQK